MAQTITFTTITERLKEQNQEFSVISLHNSFSIIVTKRGGRVFGPFKGEHSTGVFWANAAFEDQAKFAAFIASGDWNLGGDRIWVAPELPLFTKDRKDFYATTSPQASLDPGDYTFEKEPGSVRLTQHVAADVYESDITHKSFYMEKVLRPAADPLRQLRRYATLMEGVTYCGYNQTVTVADESPENPLYLEGWNLCQVVPGGKIYSPYNGEFEFVDYYEPAETMQTVRPGCAILSATGNRRYKVGYPSAIVTGRAAYLLPLENDEYCLYVKNYFNNPSSVYCCEPFDQPGQTGCSLFVYNDDGGLGGFTEFEHTFQTLAGDTQLSSSTDSVQNWFYNGSFERVGKIARALLGISL